MQPIWHHYYEEAVAVLFVVDAAQPSRMADAAMLLFELLLDSQLQVGRQRCGCLVCMRGHVIIYGSGLQQLHRLGPLRRSAT
jgi:hypothetical protein